MKIITQGEDFRGWATFTVKTIRNKEQIEKSIEGYFKKAFFDNKESQFESALDWAVENAFRLGL
jgi:hypothetical protein